MTPIIVGYFSLRKSKLIEIFFPEIVIPFNRWTTRFLSCCKTGSCPWALSVQVVPWILLTQVIH